MTALLISSGGGHLTDLHRLLPRLRGIDRDRHWVTFDTPQSRSLLACEQVLYVDYTGPRDVTRVVRHMLVARRLLSAGHPYSALISTGSGLALSFLPLGRVLGVACHYIECSARSMGPSATGRVLGRIPGIALYGQHRDWVRPPWSYEGSVFDGFVCAPQSRQTRQVRRVVVTVGTMQRYGFRRLLERLVAVLPADVDTLWQVGCTDVSGLPITAQRQLPASDLQAAMEAADVVVAHAGSGSSVTALDAGKKPVLVPRLQAHGENVDDHQVHFAAALAARGLAIVRTVEELTFNDLCIAAASTILVTPNVASFDLVSPASAW